jgi:DNA mismatch repair protein MutL
LLFVEKLKTINFKLFFLMSSIIQLLPDHVANQIAAEKWYTASVVKELLENAVDANASDIKLIIKEAGKH